MARFEVPEGWSVQAFRFTLDPTAEQSVSLARHFGARRKAFNWTVATLKSDIEAWHAAGAKTNTVYLRVRMMGRCSMMGAFRWWGCLTW
jgi:putative transposase